MSSTTNPPIPGSSALGVVDILVFGVVEVVKAQFTYISHIVTCRREVQRLTDAKKEDNNDKDKSATARPTSDPAPVNPIRLIPLLVRRQGLRGIAKSVLPLFLGRIAIEFNVRIAGTLVGLCMPPHMAPEGAVASLAFVSLINTLMLPSVVPASLLNVKYYGSLPPAANSGEEKPSIMNPLSTIPVRKWYSKAWMVPLGDFCKQLSMRILLFGFEGLLQRFLGFPRLALFVTMFSVGQAISFPLQVVYTRYQLALGTPQEYGGIREAVKSIREKEGIAAFYDGYGYHAFGSIFHFFLQQ